MARKAILEGGKRDEIIAAAAQLFFTEGYESTSVRKVLEKVGGEVGMFYHYFKSKEELFDVVVDRFFRQFAVDFEKLTASVQSPEDFIAVFLPFYETSMAKYKMVEGNMHWTIRFALHDRTVLSLIPFVEEFLRNSSYRGKYPLDIAAAKLLADISAAIHSESFSNMDDDRKKQLLLELLRDNIG